MMKQQTLNRLNERGSNLAFFACTAVLLLACLGVSIYLGLQAYLKNEIQKSASTASMVGASVYYSGLGSSGRPAPDRVNAEKAARDTFLGLVQYSKALKGFGIRLKNVSSNDHNDSITVEAEGDIMTPFLSAVGIRKIALSASGTARALKYEPTQFIGPVSILPNSMNPATYFQVVNLAFPLVDGPGTELYIEQVSQQPYGLEACNETECYDLVPGATPVGSGKMVQVGGENLLVGSATVDLEKAKVRKASKLRITHGNLYVNYYAGSGQTLQVYPTPLNIDRIMLFGYAGTCPDAQNCPIPAGLQPVE